MARSIALFECITSIFVTRFLDKDNRQSFPSMEETSS